MDGSQYEKRVHTLYGVVHKAMEEEKIFDDLRQDIKKWLYACFGVQCVCTVVAETDVGYDIVVRYHESFQDMTSFVPYKFCEVPVLGSYLEVARVRYHDQCW